LESYYLLEGLDRSLSQVKVDWDTGKYYQFKMVKNTYDGILSEDSFAIQSDYNGFFVFGVRNKIAGNDIGFTVGYVENLNTYRDEPFFSD